MQKPPADGTLKGETTDASHQPPQAQQHGALSSQTLEQIPLLATESMEKLEGVAHVGADGSEDQVTDIEEPFGVGALPDSNGGQENLAVDGQPAAAASPTEANSFSTETESSPSDENEAQEVSRADCAAGSSETARTAGSGESDSAHSSPEQPPQHESVDGDCETRVHATEARGRESPQDAGTGRRRSDMVDSTSPRVGGSETGEGSSGQVAAYHDEDQPAGAEQPVGVPAVHAPPSGSELSDLQPATGNNLPKDTSSCESSRVNSTVEQFCASPSREDSRGRVLLVAGDAGKLADVVISSSLVAVAAAVKATSREKYCQPGPGGETNQLPIQEAWQGVPSAEQIDAEKEAVRLSTRELTEESTRLSSAPIRTDVVNSFLAGVYEIVSALGAAAAAKAQPSAVESSSRTATDSATVVVQHQPVPIEREGSDHSDQLDKTEDRLLPESNVSVSAPESGSMGEPATAADDERPPSGGNETVRGGEEDEKPTGTVLLDDRPSPPSSASLRAAVVQDFMSETSETIASELLKTAPGMTPATKTLSDEPPPTRDKATDCTDKAKDHVPRVPSTSILESEALVDPATAAGDEIPPTSGDEVVGGRVEDEQPKGRVPSDDCPGPPSSVSLRATVVQDFMSNTCGTIASELAAATVEIPPDMAPATRTLSEEPVPARDKPIDDIIPLDKTGDHVPPVPNASASESESLVEPATVVGDERMPISDGVAVDGGLEDEQRAGTGPIGDHPGPPSPASLRAAVVQDFMSETRATIASEVVTAVLEIPPDMAAAAKTLSEEHTEGTIQLDKTEDHVQPVPNVSASEKESLVEPATAVGDERIKVSDGMAVDSGVEDEQPTGTGPTGDHPSSSFVSDTFVTVASEAAAAVMEIPPDMAPATKTMPGEPWLIGEEEFADSDIQLDKTEDHAFLVSDATASESAGDNRPPIDGDEMADDEKRIRDAPSSPTPPSSASLRGAVVANFLSDAYETTATTEVCAATEPSAPNEHAGSVSASAKDPTTGVVELDISRGSIEQSLPVFDTHQSEQGQRQEQRPANTQKPDNEAAKQEEEAQHQTTVLVRRSSSISQRPLLPSESLHIAVVEGCLSGTLSGLLSAEAEAEAAADGQRDQATLDGPPSREPRAAARTAAIAGDVEDGGEATREDTAAIQVMRNSLVEAMAVTKQRSTSPRDDCSTGEEDRGAAQARDGVYLSTPPGTPEEEGKNNANPGLDVPSESNLVDNGHPPNPRSVEALAYLAKAGARAKSQGEASEKTRVEAAEWLSVAGTAAKTAQDSADKARADALSWLRDTGAKALSSKGRQREETLAPASSAWAEADVLFSD